MVLPFKSDPTIGQKSDTGDRGVPALVKDASGNYTVQTVDASGNTVIIGTVTANAGTNLDTSALALENGGHLASIDTKLTNPLPTQQSGVTTIPLPVSIDDLDANGNLPVALASGSNIAGKFGIDQTTKGTTNGVTLVDKFASFGQFTPMRDMKVCEAYRLVGTVFGASNDAQFWTVANSGADSAAGVATGFATLSSGTANSGYGQITSVRVGRFMFAHPHLFRCALRINDLTKANCTRRWGAFSLTATTSPLDGFFFSFDGANALSVNYINNGTPTSVASGSFNGSVSSYTMDTNVHAYEIMFFEMKAEFYIDNVLIHTFTPTTAKMASNLTLPITATSINSAGGTVSGTMELWAGSILRLGRANTESKSVHLTTAATTVCKIGAGTLHRIVVNNAGGTLITVYDNTAGSGTVLAVINTPATANCVTLEYGIPFFIGLTIVTTGTWDLSVCYE